jgi:hypothetical protein
MPISSELNIPPLKKENDIYCDREKFLKQIYQVSEIGFWF